MISAVKRRFRSTVGSLIVLAAVAAVGCGKSAEEAAEEAAEGAIERQSGGEVQADISGERMTIKTREGELAIDPDGGLELPQIVPPDLPILPGARVVMSARQAGSLMLELETDDAKSRVVEAYQSEMKAKGWNETASVRTAEIDSLQYEKGEGREASVSVRTEAGRTRVVLVVTTEP